MALPTNAQDTVALLLDILPWLSINDIQSRISQYGFDFGLVSLMKTEWGMIHMKVL